MILAVWSVEELYFKSNPRQQDQQCGDCKWLPFTTLRFGVQSLHGNQPHMDVASEDSYEAEMKLVALAAIRFSITCCYGTINSFRQTI